MRPWKNSGQDDGSLHCLGNGRLCVYEQGPNLLQVFGPPYSAPAFFKLWVEMDAGVETRSERLPGAAIWTHQVAVGGQAGGEITDFVDAELPCLVRRLQLAVPLHFRLAVEEPVRIVENGGSLAHCDGGLLLEVPAGKYFYHVYPFPTVLYHQVAWRGPVKVSRDGSSYAITCGPGECELFFAGGPDYPQAITCAESALAVPFAGLFERTQQAWAAFTRARRDFTAALPSALPQRDRLLQTIDDVAVLIKAQQSVEGGILAGHNYHMAYVRDQYGTSRALLALGHIPEARAVLEFYWRIWQRYGVIHNGQAVGWDGVFHIHENDEVELTGYLIQQAFDLLAYSGDKGFLESIFPMLEWAWQCQVRNLVDGMLPFNGDETYIAGGMLPRSAINDGSAEATLLFITGGEKLLDWVEAGRRWPPEILLANRCILESAKTSFRKNFMSGGQLVTNNPARAAAAPLPRFRHGVCEKCQADKRLWYIVWTERNAAGRYLCPKCLAEGPFPAAEPITYVLQSVSLAPFYLGAPLPGPDELKPAILEIAERFHATGRLPTRQDDADAAGAYSVGYDYGFLLNALAALKHPLAADLYQRTLDLLDPTGAWVEYYLDNRPMGTRCRPWESAINLEAILKWALAST
jgi:hypothetical protein